MSKLYTYLLFLVCIFYIPIVHTQIVINEIYPLTNKVEIKNIGGAMEPIANWELCRFPDYDDLGSLTNDCGSTNLQPGQLLVVTVGWNISGADDEMGLYVDDNFGSAASIRDYVEWGTTGHTRSGVAVAAGIWTPGDFVPGFPNTSSLEYDGTGESSGDWSPVETNSLCAENGSIGSSCNLTTTGLGMMACDDNLTPSNDTDDFITFELNPLGDGLGSGYSVTVSSGTISPTNATYGIFSNFQLNSGSAGGGNITLTVTDQDDPTCSIDVLVIDPGSCSGQCLLTITQVNTICDDDRSSTDPSDDFYLVNVNATAVNPSQSGFFTVLADGAIKGVYSYNVGGSFILSADGSTQTLLFRDNDDWDCNVSQIIGPLDPCSNGCTLSSLGLSDLTCNDNGTPSDPSDDYVEFTLDPNGNNIGSDYTVSVVDHMVNPIIGTYGSPSSYRLAEGSASRGTTLTIIVTDNSDSSCSLEEIVPNSGSCSTDCNITVANLSSISCRDNGTDTDPNDDFITFTLSISGNNLGNAYHATVNQGSISPTSGNINFQTTFTLQAGSAGSGDVILTLVDGDDPTCSVTLDVTDPGSCSGTCNITSTGLSESQCRDNNTSADTEDDFIAFLLNPQGSNLSGTYSVSVSSGTVTPTSANYGGEMPFRLQDGSAGSGNVTLTITDANNPSCTLEQMVLDFGPCSNAACIVSGGEISTQDNLTVCTGDDTPSLINLSVTNQNGTNGTWLLVAQNATNTILAISSVPQFNLDDIECFRCMIVFLSYEDDLSGLQVGQPFVNLVGCYDESNALPVTQFSSLGGQVTTNENTNICLDDNQSNIINIEHTGTGINYTFILTDVTNNVIQEISANFDFTPIPPGDYRVYGVAYDADLSLASTINDLTAQNCLDISDNFIPISLKSGAACIVGTRDPIIDKSLIIYPNPTSHSVQMKLTDTNLKIDQVRIFDITGKTVRDIRFTTTSNIVNLDHVINGVYHIQVLINGKYYYRKLVVLR